MSRSNGDRGGDTLTTRAEQAAAPDVPAGAPLSVTAREPSAGARAGAGRATAPSGAPPGGAVAPAGREDERPDGTRRARRRGAAPQATPLAGVVGEACLDALRGVSPSSLRSIELAHLEARRQLPQAEREHLDAWLGTLLRGVAAAPAGARADELRQAERDTREHVARELDRDARRRYTAGLLGGVGSSLLLLAMLYGLAVLVVNVVTGSPVSRALPPAEHYALRDALVCVGGGAAGAVVSVLLRLARTHRLPTGVTHWVLAAFYRVALGWFFAAALLFALKSGLLALFELPAEQGSVPTERVRSWFFWGFVGFLAGFNEAWVKNLLTREPDQRPAAPTRGEPEERQTGDVTA